MEPVDLTVEICGMSGDGTIAAGGILNEAICRTGFSVLAFDSYPAEIRGFGRCVTRTRIGSAEMLALSDRTHVLISLDDKESLSRIPFLAQDAVVLFDNRPPSYVDASGSLAGHVEPEMRLFGMPLSDLAAEASGSTRGRNLTALGGFAALFRVEPGTFHEVITRKFGAKGDKVLGANLKSFDAGYRYAQETFKGAGPGVPALPPHTATGERILLSGNEAIARGALAAGVKLYFGYPITPATPIMEYLAKALPGRGGRVVQMEDEIASIGAVMGSFFSGSRAMTATSGPGFALMTELITHGVMAENPAVIVDAQRGGPATGLPTKTEQSDLHAAVFGGPGDSARIVIAPTNVTECYAYTLRSFQLAEKYQIPVIVLTDFFLNNRVENVSPPAGLPGRDRRLERIPGRGEQGPVSPLPHHGLRHLTAGPSRHGRVPVQCHGTGTHGEGHPRLLPGVPSEDDGKAASQALSRPGGSPAPGGVLPGESLDVGVIAWGSTFGSALEAVMNARQRGHRVGALKLTSLFPFHEAVIRSFMKRCKAVLIPELNYEGQLANLIGHLSGKDVVRLNRVTGVPLSPTQIYRKIEEILAL